jgi:hypothetical protein
MLYPTPTAAGTSRKTARPVAAATSTRSRMPLMPDARSARTKARSSTSTARTGRSRTRTATGTTRIHRRGDARANSIPVLGTEPESENRIRSCCGSTPGIRFYCKPVTLVRCREIRGEIRFSGRVVGKWLCEMTSAFIIKELRGARALRLFCGRSSFPPFKPVNHEFSGFFSWAGGLCPLRAGFLAKFTNERNILCNVSTIRRTIAQNALIATLSRRSRATPQSASNPLVRG